MAWWKQKLTDVIGLDPRSLAVFRIGLGLVLMLMLFATWNDLVQLDVF